MLVPNEITTIASCADGTSNTLIVSEQGAKVANQDLRNRYYSPWGGVTFSTPVSAGNPGDSWGMGLTCVAYRINTRTLAAGCDNVYDGSTVINSEHSGGVMALLTDGAVRFVSESMDFTNLQKLCVRDDGLVVEVP